MATTEWILFLSQLPSAPSSLRVTVWRRMRAAGAVSLQNGVWVLPNSPRNAQFVNEMLAYVKSQEGNASIFMAKALVPEDEDRTIGAFRDNIDQEHVEFLGRCQDFFNEIDKETAQKKFTFAELDENEEELQKLTSWLRKIKARDFFGGSKAGEASSALDRCHRALKTFEKAVYKNEGLSQEKSEGE